MIKQIKLISLLLCVISISGAKAQDVIVKTDNTTIISKVEEVSAEAVKYRKWDNLNGPLYVLNASEIVSINYSNGSVDIFKKETSSNTNSNTAKEQAKIAATPAQDNEQQKSQYDKLPTLNLKESQKPSKDFFPIMAFTENSVISTQEITVIIQPEAVEFYDSGWKVKIGYLISMVNKTDAPLYVDRANSFRVFNDMTSKSYWNNKQISVSHGNSTSSGIGLGIGNIGIGVGGYSSSSYTENHEIDRFVVIAPRATANLVDYKYIRLSETKAEFKTVSDIDYFGFALTSDSPVKVGEVKEYTEATSPYINKFYITYSTDPEFSKTYHFDFELYAKWLVGAKLAADTWSNLSPTANIVKKVKKVVPQFWTDSLAIIGMPGKYY